VLKLLANENVPRLVVTRLRERGHDVQWGLEENRGIADPIVLEKAWSDRRVLLTLDKDFGELVFQQGMEAACGVILIRLLGTKSQSELAQIVVPVLEAHESAWANHFSVIGRRRVRVKPLPQKKPK
jgi:predicted nuclease of predicted toxin-antitoxin system